MKIDKDIRESKTEPIARYFGEQLNKAYDNCKDIYKTKKEFADSIEVTTTTVSAYFNGKMLPTLYTATEIAKALHVPMDYLFIESRLECQQCLERNDFPAEGSTKETSVDKTEEKDDIVGEKKDILTYADVARMIVAIDEVNNDLEVRCDDDGNYSLVIKNDTLNRYLASRARIKEGNVDSKAASSYWMQQLENLLISKNNPTNRSK